MAQIFEFPETPNKFGITPTIAQELIANGCNPNLWRDIQKWFKDLKEGPPDGYA